MTTRKDHIVLRQQQSASLWWAVFLLTMIGVHFTEARHSRMVASRDVKNHAGPFQRHPQLLLQNPSQPQFKQSILLTVKAQPSSVLLVRGGASSSPKESKKSTKTNLGKASHKKTKKKTKQPKTSTAKTSKDEIASVLQEDAASAMGNAIRHRADQLLQSNSSNGTTTAINSHNAKTSNSPLVDQIDQTVSSVGWALGASDRFSTLLQEQQQQNNDDDHTVDEETGGVETSTTAVLVHYFRKSHGGSHAVQCLCSLVATVTGVLAILWPIFFMTSSTSISPSQSSQMFLLGQTLLQRCMLFAMMKHVSGLLAASVATAKAIPQLGLRNARLWIHDLVQDPVSQYVFYTASVLWWLRTTATSSSSSRWWQSWKTTPLVVAGPVVLREWISTMLVISDVLVLWVCTNQKDEDKGATIALVQSLLRVGQKGMDALMSILVTPSVWKPATAAQRQAILARLTSRTSLLLEVLVGLFMTADFFVLTIQKFLATTSSQSAPASFTTILRVGLCAQLYLQFLWVRRKKISKVATKIRGGAAQFPMYVLDILLDPAAAMGMGKKQTTAKSNALSSGELPTKKREWTLKEYIVTGLGLD